jgi:hypothetical protein
MKITIVDEIHYADVFDQGRNTVFVVSQVVVMKGRPEIQALAASIVQGNGEAGVSMAFVLYHYGRKAWCLCLELLNDSAAVDYLPGNLCELLEKFEQLTGVTLPTIMVVDIGVGIYDTKGERVRANPWEMEPGGKYEFFHQERVRRYTAAIYDGTSMLAADRSDTDLKYFDPTAVFDAAAWASMTKLSA